MFVKKVFPDTASASDTGELCIGGMTSTDLVEQFDTPLYVLDQKTIEARCESFVDAFTGLHSNTDVVYASKAYINASLASVITSKNMGFDVVSGGELAIIAASGADLSRVYFHGNNKTEDELTYAVRLGIGRIVVDSFYELELLNKVAKDLNVVQGVLLRISPAVDPHTHVYTTTGILDSKFGFAIDTGDAEEAILEAIESSNIDLKGVHFHLGSPIFEIEPYEVAVDLVLRFVHRFSDKFTLEEFSPGGGFAIAYTRNDDPPQIQEYAEAIVTTMRNTCSDLKMDLPKLIIEPGRSIIGPAGVALYTVGAIKDIPGVRKYVSVDGGMGDNIRPALYESEYEAVVLNKIDQENTEIVTIAGKYCESGDILIKDINLPHIEKNDLICIPASGAYCIPMSSNYNMNLKPAVILVQDGKSEIIRKRETYDDILSLEVF